MNERNSGVTGIVEMPYNWLFYGVIHGGIGSYAHFHDACLKYLKLFVWTHIIIADKVLRESIKMFEYISAQEAAKKMGYFRKTSAEAM